MNSSGSRRAHAGRLGRIEAPWLAWFLLAWVPLGYAQDPLTEGQAIYREGRLPAGQSVLARREAGMNISGAAAACANCHKRSGLGTLEGQVTVPPIAGAYLFHRRASTIGQLDMPHVPGLKADREPYTDATLARAIRYGVAADGRVMSLLMPRFKLNDGQLASLIGYLRQLTPRAVPGVDPSTVQFATIVTPEADPEIQKGVLNVLTHFFEDKNHSLNVQSPSPQASRHGRPSAPHYWRLHVWALSGPPETWEAQLRAHLKAQPVFAILGSLGGRHWQAVHRFCEAVEVPCLFPIVDEPVVDPAAFDNVYFSRGVLLEAALVAHDLGTLRSSSDAAHVVQVYRADDVGADAAAALRDEFGGRMSFVDRPVPEQAGPAELARAVNQAAPGDALVLWLRAPDLAALPAVPAGVRVAYVSGRMGGLERAPLAADWRAIARMTYPFDLPQHRRVQVDYPLGWFRLRGIPLVNEQAQADAYLACMILSEAFNHMGDAWVRDYLVERIQEMLEHQLLTGYYPRLSLAPGQSFASKGGYVVRFTAPSGEQIVPNGPWIAP